MAGNVFEFTNPEPMRAAIAQASVDLMKAGYTVLKDAFTSLQADERRAEYTVWVGANVKVATIIAEHKGAKGRITISSDGAQGPAVENTVSAAALRLGGSRNPIT